MAIKEAGQLNASDQYKSCLQFVKPVFLLKVNRAPERRTHDIESFLFQSYLQSDLHTLTQVCVPFIGSFFIVFLLNRMEAVRPFYKVVEHRRRKYKGSDEYLIQWSENHQATRFEWVSSRRLTPICEADELNGLILTRFNEWYSTHRWGERPNRTTATQPILQPLYTTADNQRLFTQGYGDLDLDNTFDKILSRTMNEFIQDGLFDFATGFNNLPPYLVGSYDRKLVEIDFISTVYRKWNVLINDLSPFKLILSSAGYNTWYLREYYELFRAAKNAGYYKYLLYPSTTNFGQFIPEQRSVVFLFCESNDFIPNAYSVIVRRPNLKRKRQYIFLL